MRLKLIICFYLFAVFFCCTSIHGDDQTNEKQIYFRAKWDGKVILGISEISGLRRVTNVVEHRQAAGPNQVRYAPGISRYAPITLKRPRTHDTTFEQWANKVWNLSSGTGNEISLKDYRKDIIIEIYDSTGMVLMAFKVYRCWPSEYIALSDLDMDDDALAMEVLILHHEGWERDYDVR